MGRGKTLIRALGVLALAGLMLGCPGTSNLQPTTGEISGRALFSGLNDSSGIVVTAEPSSRDSVLQVTLLRSPGRTVVAQGVTDSLGVFLLSGIPPGTYTVYASSQDSLEKAVLTSVEVVAGQRASAGDLVLTPVGDISGKATLGGAASGNLGIMVYVAGTSWSAMTTDSGAYTISGVPAGRGYQLVAVSLVAAGYQTTTIGIDVVAHETARAPDLALQPKALVTFDSRGGSAVAAAMADADDLVPEPAAPFKDGFHFSGWFRDAEASRPWDFDADPVSTNITLYAGWLAPPATLAYTLVGGEYSVSKGATALSGVVAIPDRIDGKTVSSIATNGFQSCTAVTGVLLPSRLRTIENSAFIGCSALARIDIPEGVTTIGSSAFASCASLGAVTLPESLTALGPAAFLGCTALVRISPIPDGVTGIPENAFSGCGALREVELPGYLTAIGNSAFAGCGNLASLDLPPSLASIGSYAFEDCRSLVSLSVPGGVTRLLSYTFSGCSSLASLSMPGVTAFGNGGGDSGSYLFSDCTSLRSITIPSGTTAIPNGLCRNCAGLGSVSLPVAVTSVGDYAFSGTNIASVNLPVNATIGSYAFYNCPSLMTVYLNGNAIGECAFAYCDKLSTISYSAGAAYNTIGNSAFSYCTSLPAQNIANVTSIGRLAFSHCPSITSVGLSAIVTSVGDYAFGYDGALASVTSMASSTPPTGGYSMFYECRQLTAIHVLNETALANFKAATGWSTYSGIIVTP